MTAASDEKVVIDCRHLGKSYRQGNEVLTVLKDQTFRIHRGESVAIVGNSGAGKSTLLNLMGGLDRCDEGAIYFLGHNLATISDTGLARLRNQQLGFVYQFHHLLSEFSAKENVALPLQIGGIKKKRAFIEASALLERVGLGDRLTHRPYELSGGERQRVAIARALVRKPACVLMDEPTGNLDEQTAFQVQKLIQSLNSELQTCFVIVTHDKSITARQHRTLLLQDGSISEVAHA